MSIESEQEQYQLLLEDKEILKTIRSKFNIDEPRFLMGLTYVGLTLDGNMSKTKAYSQAFKADAATAAKVSAQFHRAKWIQELIMHLRPADNSLYLSEIKKIIGTGMTIVHDSSATHRERIDAMKALQPYIKAEKLVQNATGDMAESEVLSVIAKLDNSIKLLASAGKMVNENGEIIDVTLIT